MSKVTGLISIVLLVVLLLGVNIVADRALPAARIDLTEGRLYTIRPESKRIARSPEEPIHLKFYYSKDLARGIPSLEGFGRRVRSLLDAFARASDGKIVLEVINPEPFSEAEDQAVADGISPQPLSPTENLYFGLVATNALDGREVIPLFRPEEERFLEYRIASIITKLARPDKPKLGLITGLPMTGGFDERLRRARPEWMVLSELRASFDVQMIEQDAGELPDDLDVLMIVHPKAVTPETAYSIDQYILGGGRAVIFVDPVCEADQQQSPPGMAQIGADRSSDLPPLFSAWGVSLADGQLAGDLDLAISVRIPGPVPETVPYLIWLSVGKDQMPDDDPVTGNLTRLNIASPGFFERAEEAPVQWEPLIRTTDNAGPVPVSKVEVMPDPKGLLKDFAPGDAPLVLAARLTGKVPTAFPDGPPSADDEADTDSDAEDAEEPADADDGADKPEQLMESTDPINVIVVADCDLLEDGGWVQEARLGGVLLGHNIFADNGAFAVNAAEQMAGSKDLLALRGRGTFARPFTLLESMQRQAEAQFLATEQSLQDEIEQTRKRISDLQMARGDTSGSLVLTPEQEAEIDRLNKVLVEKRKELRDVQLNLRKDIEALQTKLKIINTALVPALLCVFALMLAGARATRRRADRKRGGRS